MAKLALSYPAAAGAGAELHYRVKDGAALLKKGSLPTLSKGGTLVQSAEIPGIVSQRGGASMGHSGPPAQAGRDGA